MACLLFFCFLGWVLLTLVFGQQRGLVFVAEGLKLLGSFWCFEGQQVGNVSVGFQASGFILA